MIFSFGQIKQERVEVDVHGYACQASGERWNDNLLKVEIRVQMGAFYSRAAGVTDTGTLTKTLSRLYYQINCLSETNPKLRVSDFSIRIEPQGECFSVQLYGDGKGHIHFGCWFSGGARVDLARITLHFDWLFDQSHLETCIRELENVILQYPARVA